MVSLTILDVRCQMIQKDLLAYLLSVMERREMVLKVGVTFLLVIDTVQPENSFEDL